MRNENLVNELLDHTEDVQLSSDEKTWGMLCHLLTFSGFMVPLGSVLGPLIMWLVKKDESAFVDDQGKESLNFQITTTILMVIGFITAFIFIGFLIIFATGLFWFICTIIATVKANEGEKYRYPFNFRFIK